MISSEISSGPADLAGDVPSPEQRAMPLADIPDTAERDGWAGEAGSQVDVDGGLLNGLDSGTSEASAATETSVPAADAVGGDQTTADRLLAPRDATDDAGGPAQSGHGQNEAAISAEETPDGAADEGADAAAGGNAGGGARDGDLSSAGEAPDPERGEPEDTGGEASAAAEAAAASGDEPSPAEAARPLADDERGDAEPGHPSSDAGPGEPSAGEAVRAEVATAPEEDTAGSPSEAVAGPPAKESSGHDLTDTEDETTSGDGDPEGHQTSAKGTAGADAESSNRPKAPVERPFKTAVPVSDLAAGRELGHDRKLAWVSEGSPSLTQGLTVDPGLARILMEQAKIDELVVGFHADRDSTYTKTYPTPYEIKYFGDPSHRGAILSFNREEQASRAVDIRRPGETAEAAWARQLSRATAAASDRMANRRPDAQNEDNERSLGRTIFDTITHPQRVPAMYRFLTKPRWQVIKEPAEHSE